MVLLMPVLPKSNSSIFKILPDYFYIPNFLGFFEQTDFLHIRECGHLCQVGGKQNRL